jgi:glycosyltransferase involved in cell wall biosynthesis
VADEKTSPHEAFAAKSWKSCPCGIAVPSRPRERRLAEKPYEVLFVGSLQEGKGVLELLKTARILKERGRDADIRFRIAGKWFSPEFEAEATSLLAAWDLGKMVEFVGQLTGDAKWDAYYRADLFFFPTHYASEATPIVIMEALGTGLPVVSTQWAGIPAMLEGCNTATLIPVRSPEKFAEAVESWRNRKDDASRISARSCAHYEKRFTSEGFIGRVESALLAAARRVRRADSSSVRLSIYLADQHPGQDRSYGISRMSQMVMASMQAHRSVEIETIVSATSQQAPLGADEGIALPWGTRTKWVRLLTDHVHPMLGWRGRRPDVYYFPKGYLPLLSPFCRPSAVTIHDTIVQYDADHYPEWRSRLEYAYWAKMLAHTLKHANRILTVSESAKRQIEDFMKRHRIPSKEITVTYEPCSFEELPQPVDPVKENYVIHLASVEPHKRTAHLIRCWHEAEASGRKLPMLQLIGKVPPEVQPLLSSSRSIMKRPFLEDQALQAAYRGARALILPSEIEGFGLPALEAYYLGTPVCFVKDTSVEEVLAVATGKGSFRLDSPDSLFSALEEVMAMTADEIRACGLKLRGTYASDKVCERMVKVFGEMAGKGLQSRSDESLEAADNACDLRV